MVPLSALDVAVDVFVVFPAAVDANTDGSASIKGDFQATTCIFTIHKNNISLSTSLSFIEMLDISRFLLSNNQKNSVKRTQRKSAKFAIHNRQMATETKSHDNNTR